MWSPLVLLFIVGVAVADYEHGWKIGQEYQYLVRSRTLTGLEMFANQGSPVTAMQYTGILMKAVLSVQASTSDTLHAKITRCQYAQVHKELPEGWESHIPHQMLQYKDLPMSGQPFAIKMKHGVVRDLIVDKNVPTWEVNIIKSIISQIQVDTQGENAKRNRDTQIPRDNSPYAMFLAMEDMVSGKCEVLYDIQPLSDQAVLNNPELVPMPELRGTGEHLTITKTKNYNRCEQRAQYQFVIDGSVNWGPEHKNHDKFLSKASVSRIIISGDLKSFTIQSSVTTGKVVVSPNLNGRQQGTVMSKMNLTLASMKPISNPLPMPNNPESTGNLVYTYNTAFSQHHRRLRRPSVSPNSLPESESSSADASSDSWGSFGEAPRHFRDNNARSSLSASSMASSEEIQNFWQAHPKLEEAPENPLLPFFIGNKGKAISMSGGIDVVQRATTFIQEIADELEVPNSMPEKETLEKFTILVRLIATMNRQQIIQMEGSLLSTSNQVNSNEREQVRRESARAVLRDAVAQVGTGPALLTIVEWIENGKIEGWEAAAVVARIPKTARTPTPEYVDTLFTLITKPEVQRQYFLNTSAIVSFAELVRRAQVANSSIQHSYPIDSFGRTISRRNDVVIKKYIPYLADQLKRAIRDGDSPRIQTYILGLANIAHPKILSVFEPYLEGKQEVSTFQRLLMVASLSKLAELNPRLTRSVLYKIYLNTWDSHEIRCAAVYLLMMKTNPPLNMLQRMAQFTNFDTNRHVNSAVKSAIESAATLVRPEWIELSNNARAARNLLNPSEYSFHHSQFMMTDANLEKHKLAYKLLLSYIGSDESWLPNSGYLGLQMSYGGFTIPTTELTFMISSFKSLMDAYLLKRNHYSQSAESPVEKLARMLNLEGDGSKQVEGNFKLNSEYISGFLPFDNHTIDRIPNFIMNKLYSLQEVNRFNMNKLMSYDAIISFPTETGLPFVCSINLPEVSKVSGSVNVDVTEPKSMITKVNLRMLYAQKLQGQVGFVTPFDGQQFISGVDVNIQAFLPGTIQLQGDDAKRNLRLELRPMKQDPHVRMLHYSVIPYTSKQNIMSLQPVILEKTTQKVLTDDISSIKLTDPTEVFSIDAELDGMTEEEEKSNWLDKLLLLVSRSDDCNRYERLDVYMDPLKQPDNMLIFTTTWDTVRIGLKNTEDLTEPWPTKIKAPVNYNSKMDSTMRKKQFLEEVSKGIVSGDALVIDASVEIPRKVKNQWTMAVARNSIEQKYRTLFNWHIHMPQEDLSYEICSAAQTRETPISPLDFDKAINGHPKYNFEMEIRHGETCTQGERGMLWGELRQSKDFKEALWNKEVVKKCKEEMKKGNKALLACQQAIDLASTTNEMDVKVRFESELLRNMAAAAVEKTKDLVTSDMDVSTYSPDKKSDVIDMNIKISPNFDTAEARISCDDVGMKVKNIKLTDRPWNSASLLTSTNNVDSVDETDIEPSCVIDKNQVMTFDGKTYPLKLGKCSHVAMTTFPKYGYENLNELMHIPENMRVNVIVKNTDDDKKEIKMTIGEKEVLLLPGTSGSRPEVLVNGQKIQYSKTKIYQQEEGTGKVAFEIGELPGDVVLLTSTKYDIRAIYDGERIQINPTGKYKRSVRGLCGDFDDLPENDFVTPKNCVLKKAEEFAATYALKDKCDVSTLRNAKMAEKSTCIRKEMRLSDVISAQEAGRPEMEGRSWGYHKKSNAKRCNMHRTMVVPRGNEICFTMRPVPACAEGCAPVETKTKKYQLYCIPRNEGSLALKRRVEQGANPDLSQHTPSGFHEINVPLECAAA